MRKTEESSSNSRKIALIIFVIILIVLFSNSTMLIQKSNDYFIVENGALSYEEISEGYIIRDEDILKGENYKNGMVQIKAEGERVSKGDSVYRYYSKGEDELNKQIADLDIKINDALESMGTSFLTVDILNLEKQIQNVLDEMNGLNDLSKQKEYIKKIDSYISKKSNIAGDSSPAGSYVKDLISQRNSLKESLNQNSEIIYANKSGVISYRVDGMEEILGVNDFSYLNSELLKNKNLEVGTAIPQNNECGKIVNNFYCYIACITNSENAIEAKIGDKVKIKLPDATKIDAEIAYIVDENKSRVLVFKISRDVEKLIEYRKISLEIIWWDYSGLKISNSAIVEENDLSYVYRKKAGYTEKVLIKILRQNDTFSIVTNYTEEELEKMGFSETEIKKMLKIKLYDEIVISKN